MAHVPTEAEVKKLQEQSAAKEEKKLASQEANGKDFINGGQGVIPEAVWKSLPGKKLKDAEATQ